MRQEWVVWVVVLVAVGLTLWLSPTVPERPCNRSTINHACQ